MSDLQNSENSVMDQLGGAHSFQKLAAHEQESYRTTGQQMVRLAQNYAVPIIIAPPPRIGGEINGATGCVLRLSCGLFLVTASHVLKGYEKRLLDHETTNWQVGALPPFDPCPSRIAWTCETRDLLFLRLSEEEAKAACGTSSYVVSAMSGWPPQAPKVGQHVLVSGYPRALRETDPAGWIGAGPYSAMLPVVSVGDGYFYCQIDQRDLISFNEGPLPDPGAFLGGLSGGPVLLVGRISYPLVGVVAESPDSFPLLRIATLDSVLEKNFR